MAIGGVCVAADDLRPLEAAIGDCCQRSGFSEAEAGRPYLLIESPLLSEEPDPEEE